MEEERKKGDHQVLRVARLQRKKLNVKNLYWGYKKQIIARKGIERCKHGGRKDR